VRVLLNLGQYPFKFVGDPPSGSPGRQRILLVKLMRFVETAFEIIFGGEKVPAKTERNVRLRGAHAPDEIIRSL
jgi:hypothetical protein